MVLVNISKWPPPAILNSASTFFDSINGVLSQTTNIHTYIHTIAYILARLHHMHLTNRYKIIQRSRRALNNLESSKHRQQRIEHIYRIALTHTYIMLGPISNSISEWRLLFDNTIWPSQICLYYSSIKLTPRLFLASGVTCHVTSCLKQLSAGREEEIPVKCRHPLDSWKQWHFTD